MIFKHSFGVMMTKFSLVYKILLYIFIIVVLFSAITVSALFPTLKPVIADVREIEIVESIKDVVFSPFIGDKSDAMENYNILQADIIQLKEVLINHKTLIYLSLIWIILIIYLFNVFINMAIIPSNDILQNFMSSNSKFGFVSNFFANILHTFKFGLVMSLVYVPYIIITALLMFFTWKIFYLFNFMIAAALMYAVFVVCSSIKSTFLSAWAPMIVTSLDKGVFSNLGKSFKFCVIKNRFSKIFGTYAISIILFTPIVLLLSLFTFFAGAFVISSIIMIFYQAINMVSYYRFNNMRYYVETGNVINPVQTVVD